MNQYTYRAVHKNGHEVRGKLRAQNEERAYELLKTHGLTAVQLQLDQAFSWLHWNVWQGFISTRDLAIFSEQASAMIKAGVPILQALQALQQQTAKPRFRRVVQQIAASIEGGQSLSSAMSQYDHIFSPFYMGVIKTGEASGRLATSLEALADHLNQDYNFIRKLRAALAYPVLVIITIIVVTIIIFTMVLPQIVVLFNDVHVPLPLPTRLLLGLTTFFQNYWYILLLFVISLGILLRFYLKTPEGKYTIMSYILRLPLLKILVQKIYLTRLTSMLHTLFNSNVPVVESFHLAEQAIGNSVYEHILTNTVRAIKDGTAISAVWAQEPFIPPMLTSMVEVGEKSGRLDNAFREAHSFFKRDVEGILNSVSTLLEPIMVILLGIGVAIIVVAVLLPIYNLVTVL